jgi:hypothetical protein
MVQLSTVLSMPRNVGRRCKVSIGKVWERGKENVRLACRLPPAFRAFAEARKQPAAGILFANTSTADYKSIPQSKAGLSRSEHGKCSKNTLLLKT